MTQAAVVRAGQNGEPVSQVFRYRYDALGRRIAKADAFGETTFVWEGLRLLQERAGAGNAAATCTSRAATRPWRASTAMARWSRSTRRRPWPWG